MLKISINGCLLLSLIVFNIEPKDNSQHHSTKSIHSLKQAKEELSTQEKLGKQVLLNITFKDENNQDIAIADLYKDNKPVIIVPVYYSCPHLCTLILDGLKDALNQEDNHLLGKDFKIISVSFNEEETFKDASNKKIQYTNTLKYYKKYSKTIDNNWHFLTGKKEDILKFYQSVGFRYKKLKEEYAHVATLIFTTPKGIISRYLYGVQYIKNDFKLALLEATQNKIASFTDKILLYCFRYDSQKNKYTIVAWRVMLIACSLLVIIFFIFLGVLWYHEKRKKKSN